MIIIPEHRSRRLEKPSETKMSMEIIKGLATFLLAKATHEQTVEVRRAVAAEKGDRHPDTVAADAASTEAWRAMRALEIWPIRANLVAFGLEDPIAEAVACLPKWSQASRKYEWCEVARLDPRPLSELANARKDKLLELMGVESPKSGPHPEVFVELAGKRAGHLSSDGRFGYEGAPDTRTAIGWYVATDLGREQLITRDITAVTSQLIEAVRTAGIGETTCKEVYRPLVARLFGYGSGLSRHGFCAAQSDIWVALTRELGNEQPGYPICY